MIHFSMPFSEIGYIWNNICDFDALQTADSDKWVYQIQEMLSGSIVCVYHVNVTPLAA